MLIAKIDKINVCRDRLLIPYVNKEYYHLWGRQAGQNDITWKRANSTGMPPDQIHTFNRNIKHIERLP